MKKKEDFILLNGKEIADKIYGNLPNGKGRELSIITIGDNDASERYVKTKIKACERVNLVGKHYHFKEDVSCEEVSSLIKSLNLNSNVVGIIIQRPYPKRFHGFEDLIWIEKDVDGLNRNNMYSTLLNGNINEHSLCPATPKGIIRLLDEYNLPIEGKKVVIIGRSEIVGKPLASMMEARNATVTLCHSKTNIEDLKLLTSQADIIVSAVGKAKYLNSTYLEQDNDGGFITMNSPIIIDVGMNRDSNGKLCGDVDFDSVKPYVKAITPVPKGVGPMTVAELIANCFVNFA